MLNNWENRSCRTNRSFCYKPALVIFIIFVIALGFVLASCSGYYEKKSPLVYIKTEGMPVAYTTYYISPVSIIKVRETDGKKIKQEVKIAQEEYEKLVQILKQERFPFVKEGFQKNQGTESIRIISHIKNLEGSKSNAGGIMKEDQDSWNRINAAFTEVIQNQNLK